MSVRIGETSAGNGDDPAKYACRTCGSIEVATKTETWAVFRAEGDQLLYLRDESPVTGLSSLFCNECGEDIEVQDYGSIAIR